MIPARVAARVAALILAVVALPGTARGTDARAAALARSPLFPDDSDVLSFPSAVPGHSGLLVVDNSQSSAGAGVLLGDRIAGGVFLGRREGADDLAWRAAVYPEADIVVPERILDALLAVRLGLGHTAGIGVGLSHDFERTTNRDAGDNGMLAGSVGLVASHSWESLAGGRTDSAVALDFSYFRRTGRFEVQQQIPVTPAVSLRHRSLWSVGGRWLVGVAGSMRRDDLTMMMPAAHRSSHGSHWDLQFEAGPYYQATETVGVGLSLFVHRSSWAVDALQSPPAREDQGGEVEAVLPGVRAALEAQPLPWLSVRMGLQGGRVTQYAEDGAGNSADTMGADFSWVTGVGLELEGLRLDGVLTAGLLRDGPSVLGGTAPGLFTAMSAAYAF